VTDTGFATDFVERWTAGWNSHEPARLLALMTEDIVYDDSAAPAIMHGHADVRTFLEQTWRALPDLTFRVVDGPLMAADGKVSIRWSGTATFSGPLVPPGYAPNGARVEFDGFDLYEFRDGLVCRLRTIYDMMDLARQLKLAPPVGSRFETVTAALQRLSVRVSGFRAGRRRAADRGAR
jgi:steroid delta-isomerase-like uncharacterized protein